MYDIAEIKILRRVSTIEKDGIKYVSVSEIAEAAGVSVNKIHYLLRKDNRRKERGGPRMIQNPRMIAGINYWQEQGKQQVVAAVKNAYKREGEMDGEDEKVCMDSAATSKSNILDRVFRGNPDKIAVKSPFMRKYPDE